MKPIRRLAVLLAASLVSAALAEAPIRAYRDINFGDSAEVVVQKVFEDPSIAVPTGSYATDSRKLELTRQLVNMGAVFVNIGGTRCNLEFEFNDDKLYRIRFNGEGGNFIALELDTWYRDNLVEVITRAHGQPTAVAAPITLSDLRQMREDSVVWTHEWRTNSEGVAYKIGFVKTTNRYYSTLWVEWSWMVDYIDSSQDDAEDF
ncbi:MAG: hypothetical protein KF875_03930 [Trueperaceae bacterium]|nr:hypothetical protein [Trueperaceae bacterium]